MKRKSPPKQALILSIVAILLYVGSFAAMKFGRVFMNNSAPDQYVVSLIGSTLAAMLPIVATICAIVGVVTAHSWRTNALRLKSISSTQSELKMSIAALALNYIVIVTSVLSILSPIAVTFLLIAFA